MASYDKIKFEKTLNDYTSLSAQKRDINLRTHDTMLALQEMLRSDVQTDLEAVLAAHELQLSQFRIEEAPSGRFAVYIERMTTQAGAPVGGLPYDGQKFDKMLGAEFRAIENKYGDHIHITFPFTWWGDMLDD